MSIKVIDEGMHEAKMNSLQGNMEFSQIIQPSFLSHLSGPCRNLDPVTQLYVSVDAATRDSLKAVDRPLFKDFWERFQLCLQLLKAKQQRTVYRLAHWPQCCSCANILLAAINLEANKSHNTDANLFSENIPSTALLLSAGVRFSICSTDRLCECSSMA